MRRALLAFSSAIVVACSSTPKEVDPEPERPADAELPSEAVEPSEVEEPNEPPPLTGPECGAVRCGAGLVCCNTSCGICIEPGDACLDVVCVDGVDAGEAE